MVPFRLRYISFILQAKLINADKKIYTVSIDSRCIGYKCLFIALKGDYYDGHDFVDHAMQSGADAVLVSKPIISNISQLVVNDTRVALHKLGAWVRSQVSSKIIALTGSVGKTSVKDMTTSILKNCGVVVSTCSNLNNDIGVSLTLLRLNINVDFAVIEIGANHYGEIFRSVNLVRPDVVLVNNIFASHLAGFGTLIGVAKAKSEIFAGVSEGGLVILNADSHNFSLWQDDLYNKVVWWFSLYRRDGVTFFTSEIIDGHCYSYFKLHTPSGVCKVFLPFLGYHSISNALAASALAFSVGAKLSDIVIGLSNFTAPSGRLFPINLNKNRLILDDTYNSNIGSIAASLRVLEKMPGYRVFVVSDVLELNAQLEKRYHIKIGEIITEYNIDLVLTIGKMSFFIYKVVMLRGKHFFSKAVLISDLINLLSLHERFTVLIKGSRSFAMEEVVYKLQRRFYVSCDN